MSSESTIADVGEVLSDDVASEIARAYTDQIVFPRKVTIDKASDNPRQFIGWPDDVLVLSVENQGVCAWGVSLGEARGGTVVVGGDLLGGAATVPYCADISTFVQARRWDQACFETAPLLQAQAAELDADSLAFLRRSFDPGPVTSGWPTVAVHRFEGSHVRLMLWDDDQQCDWWISGYQAEVGELARRLWHLSDLSRSLW